MKYFYRSKIVHKLVVFYFTNKFCHLSKLVQSACISQNNNLGTFVCSLIGYLSNNMRISIIFTSIYDTEYYNQIVPITQPNCVHRKNKKRISKTDGETDRIGRKKCDERRPYNTIQVMVNKAYISGTEKTNLVERQQMFAIMYIIIIVISGPEHLSHHRPLRPETVILLKHKVPSTVKPPNNGTFIKRKITTVLFLYVVFQFLCII